MSTLRQGNSGPSGHNGSQHPSPLQLISENNTSPGQTVLVQTSREQSSANQIRNLTVRFFIDFSDTNLAHNLPSHDRSTTLKRS